MSPHNKIKIIVIAIITVVVIGVGVYFWTTNNNIKNDDQQNTQIQNQSSSFSSNDSISTAINPKDYSLMASSVSGFSFNNASGDLLECEDEGFLRDGHLVKDNQIIIPSLIHLIHNYEEEKQDIKDGWDCDMVVSEFLIPANGRYLYLHIRHLTFNESRASDFYIYRLDLSNLSIKRLFSSISDINHKFRNSEYKLLSDGKRVVQWDSSGIYLADLEKDTLSILYAVSQNQWLISREEETEVMVNEKYNIEVSENQIKVGVYDKNKFQDSKTESGYSIKNYTFMNQITIPILSN